MPVNTTISTIRHAYTAYNHDKRYAGSIDVPLSEEGILDARRAASRLDSQPFDVVISSAKRRSIHTARILIHGRAPLVRSRLCNERSFGELEGRTWSDVSHVRPPILLIEVGGDLHTVNPRHAEPFEDLWERAKKFRRFVFRRYRGCSILVVSHGVFLQMFHGLLQGLSCIEALAVYPANLELNVFRFRDDRLSARKVVQLASARRADF
jgi:broad specificity phosphatase PhoE